MKLRKILIILLFTSAAHADEISGIAKAEAHKAIAQHNQSIYLFCNHFSSINNSSESIKTHIVSYTICADNKGCESKSHKVKVNPGEWHEMKQTSMWPVYHHEGHYKITCKTYIQNLAQQIDTNDITIY